MTSFEHAFALQDCSPTDERPPEGLEPDSREAENWGTLSKHVSRPCVRYAGELGQNTYAVFNVIADFASHRFATRFVCRERHSLQRRAGAWLSTFVRQCRVSDFSLATYLEEGAAGELSSPA